MTEAKKSHQLCSNEGEVVEYLRSHPDFFQRHDYLLEDLKLPHPGLGGAISLIQRQVEILREQKEQLRRQLQHLTQSARLNEVLLQRVQALVLDLIGSDSLNDALARLRAALRRDFQADAVAVRLFGRALEGADAVSPDDPDLKPFIPMLTDREPVCGYVSPEQMRFMFGEKTSELRSAAMIPLCSDKAQCLGLLAVGSKDGKRFNPEMGTTFLAHLGAVVTQILHDHLAD